METNTFMGGAPGSGKTVRAAKRILQEADAGDKAIVILTPHEHDLGAMVASQLHAKGEGHRVFVDRFTQSSFVFKLCLLPRPTSDSIERAFEIERIANGFADLLARARRIDILSTPLIREWLYNGIMLVLHQPRWRPASDLLYAFEPGHPVFEEMVAECTDPETKYKFDALTKNWIANRRELAPAARAAWACLGSLLARIRDAQYSSLYECLLQKYVLIFEADMRSKDSSSLVLGSVGMQVSECCFSHFARTGQQLPVLVVRDEGFTHGLISEREVYVDMAQGRKAGLSTLTASQSLNIDPLLRHDFFQVCGGVECGRCGSAEMAERMATEIYTPSLNYDLIGWTEERHRQVHDGFDEIQTVSEGMSEGFSGHNDTGGKSIQIGNRDRPRYRKETDVIPHRMSMNDQLQGKIGELMTGGPGDFHVRDRNGVRFENLGPLEEAWFFPELTRAKLNDFYASMASRPEFTVPSFGGNVTTPSLPSSASTPQQSNNQSKQVDSPIERLRNAGQKLFEKRDGSNSSDRSS